MLLGACVLMAATGAGFALTTQFWPLLIIAFVGTLNPSSRDVSVFLPLEHTVLAQPADPQQRTALFARNSLAGALTGARRVASRSRSRALGHEPTFPPERREVSSKTRPCRRP
jgi:hypothetical protein